MRLAFVNPDLLDQPIDEALMPRELERFWHERASPLAKSLYSRIGITGRAPFVLDQNSNPPQIHPQSSSVLRKMTEQVPGRTTMRTYGKHVLRFVATSPERTGERTRSGEGGTRATPQCRSRPGRAYPRAVPPGGFGDGRGFAPAHDRTQQATGIDRSSGNIARDGKRVGIAYPDEVEEKGKSR